MSIVFTLEEPMETCLGTAKDVPFDSLFLDPNNPRLASEDPPGYDNASELFDEGRQKRLEENILQRYEIASGSDDHEPLAESIVAQGWMPIDNIIVWQHPLMPRQYVVLEGNRRTVALRWVRRELALQQARLRRLEASTRPRPKSDRQELVQRVEQLQRIVDETEMLQVIPLAARNGEELNSRLARVLAVRHITGARSWGNYAQDLWLLMRYEVLFERQFGGGELRLDPVLIKQVAGEASLTQTKARRRLVAAKAFSHFCTRYEEELPEGESFKDSDYFLFDIIVKSRWLQQQFGLSSDLLWLPEDGERAVFEWVFKLPRGDRGDADTNPNVFYRHENARLWNTMKRYDDKHGTSFASRFDPTNPGSAPKMREVEAEWLTHKARVEPADVVLRLLDEVEQLTARTLLDGGDTLRLYLDRLHNISGRLLRVYDDAESEATAGPAE